MINCFFINPSHFFKHAEHPSSRGKLDIDWVSIQRVTDVCISLGYPTDVSGNLDVPRISKGLSVLLGNVYLDLCNVVMWCNVG